MIKLKVRVYSWWRRFVILTLPPPALSISSSSPLQIRIQYPGSVLSGTAGLQRALLGSAGKAIPAPIGQDPWRRALIGQRYLQVFAFH